MRSWTKFKIALALSSALGLLTSGIVGCGQQNVANDVAVAEVGGRAIKLREVTDYITSLSLEFPNAGEEFKARKRHLDRLIEDKLLIIGGYERTLDADISILEAVDAEKEKFLLDELYRAEVLDKVTVDEAEVKEIFNHWFDRVHFRHIVVKDQTRADSLLGALNAGADFGDLAEKFSIDQGSRFRSGDPGREFSYNELPAAIAKQAFSLEKDVFGDPVQSDMGWHILQVKETRKLESRDFEAVRPAIEASVRRRKQQERRTTHLEQVEANAKIVYDPQTLGLWREKLAAVMATSNLPTDQVPAVPGASLSQPERDMVMYTFGEDYKVGLGEYCDAMESRSPFERPDPASESELRRFAFQFSLFDILHDEALRQRLDETPTYKERVQNFLESLIADRMRNSVLVRGISVTEAEVRGFYDANPDSFVEPAAYHCREIMVNKQEEADRLAQQLRSGASFVNLAREHTARPGKKTDGGDIGWVTPSAWPLFYEPVSKIQPGEWTGPVAAVDQYSLLELIEMRPARSRAYEEVATEIFESIQRRRRDSIFSSYVDSMRSMYPVVVQEDVLKSGLAGADGQIDSARTN